MDSPTDPSDWGEVGDYSRHGGLREFDSLLRCPICYGFLNGALITPDCGHTCEYCVFSEKQGFHICTRYLSSRRNIVCSLCIRRYLRVEQVCPICRREALESRLVNNRLVDQLALNFVRNRSFLILQTTKLAERSELETKKHTSGYEAVSSPKYKSLIHGGKEEVLSNEMGIEFQDDLQVNHSGIFQMKKCSNTYNVPIAVSLKDGDPKFSSALSAISNVQPHNTFVVSHLNCSHMGENTMDPKINLIPHRDDSHQNFPGLELVSDQPSENIQDFGRSLKRKSKYIYRLMDTKRLKKLLQDDKLPTKGDKEALIWRHQEYCLLYNANLDSIMPKTEEQLRDQVLATEVALLEEKHKRKSQKLTESDETESTRLAHLKKYSDHFDQVRKTLLARKSSGLDPADS